MKVIKEYKILSKEDNETLSESVNAYIKTGWQPYGNLIVNNYDKYGYKYRQVVVKYEE